MNPPSPPSLAQALAIALHIFHCALTLLHCSVCGGDCIAMQHWFALMVMQWWVCALLLSLLQTFDQRTSGYQDIWISRYLRSQWEQKLSCWWFSARCSMPPPPSLLHRTSFSTFMSFNYKTSSIKSKCHKLLPLYEAALHRPLDGSFPPPRHQSSNTMEMPSPGKPRLNLTKLNFPMCLWLSLDKKTMHPEYDLHFRFWGH